VVLAVRCSLIERLDQQSTSVASLSDPEAELLKSNPRRKGENSSSDVEPSFRNATQIPKKFDQPGRPFYLEHHFRFRGLGVADSHICASSVQTGSEERREHIGQAPKD
jgi:hypothetical protein